MVGTLGVMRGASTAYDNEAVMKISEACEAWLLV